MTSGFSNARQPPREAEIRKDVPPRLFWPKVSPGGVVVSVSAWLYGDARSSTGLEAMSSAFVVRLLDILSPGGAGTQAIDPEPKQSLDDGHPLRRPFSGHWPTIAEESEIVRDMHSELGRPQPDLKLIEISQSGPKGEHTLYIYGRGEKESAQIYPVSEIRYEAAGCTVIRRYGEPGCRLPQIYID